MVYASLPLFAMNMFWHLPVLIVIISLVYSATRYDQWGPIFREALRWGLRLAGFLLSDLGATIVQVATSAAAEISSTLGSLSKRLLNCVSG